MSETTLKILISVPLLIAGLALVYFFMPGNSAGSSMLHPDNPAIVSKGEALYAAECASCHGANGQGQPDWDTKSTAENPLAPPHDGTGHTWQHPDRALFELTKYGTSDVACRTLNADAMPEFDEHLSDEDVIAVLSYIKSKWPRNIREQHDKVNALHAS
ncbi:MAG: cytochrome c [Rhizobiaceae bacterium]